MKKKGNDQYILPTGGNDINNRGCIVSSSFLPSNRKPTLNYKIKQVEHLLTSWASPKEFYKDNMYDVSNYSGASIMMKCQIPDKDVRQDKALLPHSCLSGGRSGFSVKLIDKQCHENTNCT